MKYNSQILKVGQSSIRKFNNLAHELGAKYFMTLGEPDFNTPDSIVNACIDSLKNHNTKYAHTYGNLDLREAISNFEKVHHNCNYSKDEIIITTGSTEALASALFTILNPGDEVIVPTPCYALYRPVIEYMNAKMVTIDTTCTGFEITEQLLKETINQNTKAILLTSPNNPTGHIYSKNTLDTIYKLVKNTEIFVILDNCYSELVYGEYHNMYEYHDIRDQIIICQSFSKPYAMTGWRIGYLMSTKEFCEQASKIHQYMIVASNTFIQSAALEALSFDVKEFKDIYIKRRDYILKRLDEIGMEYVKPDGAFYVFPSIKKYGLKSWDFCLELVKQYKVATIPGICFEADDYIRLSYCVDMETIEYAMNSLEEFIKSLEK